MPLYAVTYRYIDHAEFVARHRPEHRAYLREIADRGKLLLAGPLSDSNSPGGLLIFEVASIEHVETLANDDPFYIQGVIERRSIERWTLSIGDIG